MVWWNLTGKEVLQALRTSEEQGLTGIEAQKRLQENGENSLALEENKKSLLSRILAQMNDFMILLLIGAAVISFFISFWNGEGDYVDSVIIIAIVMLNACLGVFQESKAEKALEALKKMSAPKALVLRDGKRVMVPVEEVVMGDILVLETGAYICADARILQSSGLKTEESAITGESLGVEKETRTFGKETAIGDRKNMVLSGSYVVGGKGIAVVTQTGLKTEMGRIANLLAKQEDRETPLQQKLSDTGKMLAIMTLGICAIIFVIGMLRKEPPFTMFMTAVSLAVAAIPEGLPAIVTIVLAIGMQRMSCKNTIIRRLPAVETLGGAAVICSDKTGTLTQNRMRVVGMAEAQNVLDAEKRCLSLTLFTLCNDCKKEKNRYIGEATEKALAEYAEDQGVILEEVQKQMPRVGEIPFSSERKMMTTLHDLGDGTWMTVTKGAPDVLFERCNRTFEGKRQVSFQGAKKSFAQMKNGEMATAALRVMAVAFREWNEKPNLSLVNTVENDMVFVGLAGMIDPPRVEAKQAVSLCKKAGIRPVMITGDHVLTAKAIAEQLGIYEKGNRCITGAELERFSDAELASAVENCTVFARVAPEHKVRIVQAFQRDGKVVAMTGDGVNDAPALKAADIGCAMGKGGTEVAKGAADMILTDDNFATIVEAVREGRGIYDNIRKAIHFLLSSNIGEIITIFVAMCFGWATPLLPIHLLWVNLVTDSLPAIALGLDPLDPDCMNRPPRKSSASLFDDGLGGQILVEGMMIGCLALLAFAIGHMYFDADKMYITGRTMAFAVLSLSQLVHAFNMRSEHSLFSIKPLENNWLVGAFLVGVVLQVGIISVQPLATIFRVAPLTGVEWLIVWALALAPLPIVELEKMKNRYLQKKNME